MTLHYIRRSASGFFLVALLVACFCAIMPTGVAAQDSPTETTEEETGPTSISVGNLSTTFTYGGSGELAGVYNYEQNVRALMISGPNGSLLFDYTSDLSTGEFDRETRRTIGAEALFGGNAYLFKDFLHLPLHIYVPIRINLDYRYVQSTDPELSNLHRGAAGLGLGGGAQLRFPIGPDFIKDNLVARGSAVLVPAVATSLGRSEGDDTGFSTDEPPITASRTRMRRMFNINLEVLFTELLGDDAGVMAGYTFRAYNRSPDKPSSVGDVIDAATLSGSYVETSVQHMVRIGLSW